MAARRSRPARRRRRPPKSCGRARIWRRFWRIWGWRPGDAFALIDGSRYALLPPDAADHDLPLPGDRLTQKLRVLPSGGCIPLASWGVAPLSPARGGPDPASAPDISEALTRAVIRAMANHAELVLPPGMMRVTRPGALLARDLAGRHDGLRITGAGQQSTVLVYDPEDASDPLLWNNNSVLGLRLARLTLYTDVPGAVFARCHGSGISQDHQFIDIAFRGRWGIGVEMVPDPDSGAAGNNNSEFLFDRVHSGVYLDPFTLLLGRSSDQNLNYWVRNCKLWGWVTIARLHRGGHLHISDCDVSGYAPKAANYLVELLGDNHARGVCACSIRNLRVELKTAQALLLRSEWPSGTIDITGLDLSSQTYRMTPAAPVIELTLGEGRGPILSVSDSQFARAAEGGQPRRAGLGSGADRLYPLQLLSWRRPRRGGDLRWLHGAAAHSRHDLSRLPRRGAARPGPVGLQPRRAAGRGLPHRQPSGAAARRRQRAAPAQGRADRGAARRRDHDPRVRPAAVVRGPRRDPPCRASRCRCRTARQWRCARNRVQPFPGICLLQYRA